MYYLKKVQLGIEFIEANLDANIRLADVAKAAGMSQWHFQRVFKALANETLKTYIRSRRLANALDKLLRTRARIIDIAFESGYESQAAFTRAFKQAFGLTPNAYRRTADPSMFLKKLEFDAEYLKHINKNLCLEPEIVDQEAMVLVGLRTLFYNSDSEKNNIANKLPPLWAAFLPRLNEIQNRIGGNCYGVIRQLEDGEQLEYFAAVEVSSTKVPHDMFCVDVEASTYAKFAHRGDPTMLDNTVNYIYSSWLLSSGRRHSYGADLEIYGNEYVPNSDKSVLHYSIPLG